MGFRLLFPLVLLVAWIQPVRAQYYNYYGYNYSSINWGYFYGSQIVNNAVQGAQISNLNASVNQLYQQNLSNLKQIQRIYREIDDLEIRASSLEDFQGSVARYTKYRTSLIQQEAEALQKQRQELFIKTENGENKRPGPDFFFWVEDYATKIDRLDQSIMQRREEIDLLGQIKPPEPRPEKPTGPAIIEVDTDGFLSFGLGGADFYDGSKKIGSISATGDSLTYRRPGGNVNLSFRNFIGMGMPVANFYAESGQRYRLRHNPWTGLWTFQEASDSSGPAKKTSSSSSSSSSSSNPGGGRRSTR